MRRRPPTGLLLILVAALLTRTAVVVATPDFQPIFDAADYERHAISIASGEGYPPAQLAEGPSAFRPPLYPLALAAVQALEGGQTAYRLVGALLGTLAVLLLTLISRRLWGQRTALIAGALASVFPPLVFLNASLLSESLFIPLVLGALLAVLRGRESHELRWALAAGVLCGLATLTRTNGLLLLVPAVLGVWSARPRFSRSALAAPAALALAILITLLPWTIRNAVTFDRFVGLGAATGYLLAGTYGDEVRARAEHPGQPRAAHLLRSHRDVFTRSDLDEIERWEVLGDRGRAYMVDHPEYVVATIAWNAPRLLEFERAGSFDTVLLAKGLQAIGVERLASPVLVLGSLYAVLALAFAGALIQLRGPPSRRAPIFVWLFPLLLVVPALVFYGLARYRLAIDPFVLMLAAVALAAGSDRFARE